MKPILILLFACSLAHGQNTWIVAIDGSGDFLQLQDAVAAASPGDLILIKPGSYKATWVDKPLTIVGSGQDRTTITSENPTDSYSGALFIFHPSLTGDTLVASLTATGDHSATCIANVASPTGRMILWSILADSTEELISTGGTLGSSNSESVWINNCRALPPQLTGGQAYSLALCDTRAFVSQGDFRNGPFIGDRGEGGSHGILVAEAASVYIAEASSLGSMGAYGWAIGCQTFWSGGRGGDGIHVREASTAYITSRLGATSEGGPGGLGGGFGCDNGPRGGDGGDGIHATDANSQAFYSGQVLIPGPGGDGVPPGDMGLPVRGQVTEYPTPMPTSTMEGSGYPGSLATFRFHGDPGDSLLIAYSTSLDVVDLPGVDGQPLQCSTNGKFRILNGGVIPANGTAEFNFTVPMGAPLGQPFYLQGLLLGPHAPQLTNMSMLVVTPDW